MTTANGNPAPRRDDPGDGGRGRRGPAPAPPALPVVVWRVYFGPWEWEGSRASRRTCRPVCRVCEYLRKLQGGTSPPTARHTVVESALKYRDVRHSDSFTIASRHF